VNAVVDRVARGFSPEQEDTVWDLHRGGESSREIGRVLGMNSMAIRRFLGRCGGIRPVSRRRRAGHLTEAEREDISGRSPSTISRENARNGGRESYRAVDADRAAYVRAQRPKPTALHQLPLLRSIVVNKLNELWSPQQISIWLARTYPNDATMHISHETIYRCLYIPDRKVFDKNMFHQLRTDRSIRRPRGKKRSHGRGRIRNMVPIEQRCAAAETRSECGHLEGDLVYGTRPSAVATLVDRQSRMTHVVALPHGYRADAAADAVIAYLRRLPAHLRRTLTWDRGREMAAHERITAALEMPIYFCAPHHPWQRGTNENTNGLLRQYLPKAADLSIYTQSDLNEITARLNGRPRRVLGWHSPAEQAVSANAAQPLHHPVSPAARARA
jgi:IS30 family transposase